MKALVNKFKKRRVWGIGVFVLCTLMFLSFFVWRDSSKIKAAPGDEEQPNTNYVFQDDEMGTVNSGGMLTMRVKEQRYTIVAPQGVPGNARFHWESTNTDVLRIESGTEDQRTATLKVVRMSGNVRINVSITYTNADGDTVTDYATMTVEVVFSIQEYINGRAGVEIYKVYQSDERKALIMEYGSTVEIGDAEDPSDYLKLVFGDGTQGTWTSSNTDVIRIEDGESVGSTDRLRPVIQAVGAGPATLTVSYVDGTRTYTDSIEVYVRPELTNPLVTRPPNPEDPGYDPNNPDPDHYYLAGGMHATASGSITVENRDKIGVSILDVDHPELAIADKLVWVISKGEGENAVLVRDSLGNTGEDADEARLVYIPAEQAYRVDAKAGVYNLQFYVKGTYKNWDESRDEELRSRVPAVNLSTSVKCDFKDKEVILNLGSTYDLSEAFNIPLKVLRDNFNFNILDDGNSYIAFNQPAGIVSTKQLGMARIKVSPLASVETVQIPGLSDYTTEPDGSIMVTIRIADAFSLNISEATIAVGGTLDLYGIISSQADVDSTQFHWSVSDERYASLNTTMGRYVTVTGLQETRTNEPVIVSLAWTDEGGITRVAYCSITINKSATNFKITPEEALLEVGGSEYLQTNLTGSKNILWLSSDTSIVTVEPQTGNVAAKVTATQKTGSVVITAVNRDNDTYATAIVTVTAAITDIRIDKGDTYRTSIAVPYVFMEAIYQPTNATMTDLIWESSDPSIATVNETGMLTVLKLGQTTITVRPVYNPNGVFAQCVVTVVDDPITGLKTDVTTLNMQKGDTYDVKVTMTPENPTDRTLTWTSSKPSVATVNKDGRITAVGVGTATIILQGGNAQQVMIEVNVREKLTSIAFEEAPVEIEVNEKKKLNVILTPSTGVNTNLTFYSSDQTVVTVDKDGVITGLSVGKAMITCIAEDLGESRPITCNVTVKEEWVVATNFTIDPTETTICVGDDFTILPIFTPAETSNQQVRYETLDQGIATVTEEGLVTGVAPGQTVIECTAVETNLTALCKVTVEEAVKFSLNPSSREIAIGKSFTIKKVTKPSNIDKAAVWRTSNSRIATVKATGKVTGKKIGSCTITCTLKKYNQSATCRVKVAKLKSTLKLDKTSIRMNVGSTYRLKKTVWSNNSTTPSVKFTSSNSRVATVGSSSGKIKAKKVGSAVVTAKTKDAVHATARCRVTVIHRATGISINKTYAVCYIGSTIKLKATVKPKNATIKKVKWSSSDPNIAAVTSSGKITGYAEGDVYITATTTDGSNKSSRCFVKVMEPVPATNIMVAQQKITMERGDTAQLSYTILPDNQTDTIKMASDNTRVATVTNKGKVTAVGTGTATVTITSSSGVTATVEINVVALNKSTLRIRQYDTQSLMVLGTSDPITWYSGNDRIVTVRNGQIVGQGLGTTYVYAYVNGCRLSCRVDVVSVNTTTR